METIKYRYELFKHEISQVQDISAIPEQGRLAFLEDCYQLCVQCWGQVKHLFEVEPPADLAAEIQFFKIIKPTFTSQVNYYALLYHAELFKPPAGDKLIQFFEREYLRRQNFIASNPAFYTYYTSGNTSKDERYFCRLTKETLANMVSTFPVENDEVSSSHDHLVKELLSLEKYEQYAKRQLIIAGGCV